MLKIKLPQRTDINIKHYGNDLILEVESHCDSYEEVVKAIGIEKVMGALDGEDLEKIFSRFSEDLHEYLEKSGYIFNKG